MVEIDEEDAEIILSIIEYYVDETDGDLAMMFLDKMRKKLTTNTQED
jgi:hypothetical protein